MRRNEAALSVYVWAAVLGRSTAGRTRIHMRHAHAGTVRTTPSGTTRWGFVAPVLALGAIITTAPLDAQTGGKGFLFREPVLSVSLRGGFAHANAKSDVFSFTTTQLTLDRGDFSGVALDAELGVRMSSRMDVVIGTSYAGKSTASEMRDWVDQDDQPIRQTTSYQRVPITASVRAFLMPRGRSIGHLAWVPNRFAPYVGAGGGVMWYRFEQRGDFVNFANENIFTDTVSSSHVAPTAHGLAGIEYALSPHFALTTEGRYVWARGKMSDAFEDFDRIDLSGFSATVGLTVRF